MLSDTESETESDSNHSSDPNYVPMKKKEEKRTRPPSSKTVKPDAKKQKIERLPIKNKNHNEFFERVESPDPDPLNKTAKNAEKDFPTDDSIDRTQTQSTSKSALVVEEDEIHEIKRVLYALQRQLARVEALIKYRKETSDSTDDAHSQNGGMMATLQSYGFPVKTVEKLKEIEKNLKAENFKAKLVRIHKHIYLI